MNSSLLACYLTVVMLSLADLSAAGECGGYGGLTNCETKRAGEDGMSCQFTKPDNYCLKEGEWMKMDESIKGLTAHKNRAIGCKTDGKGIVAGAADQRTFKSNVAHEGLKTQVTRASEPCAEWQFASIGDASDALIKAIKTACKSSEDKLGSSSCKDIFEAFRKLATLL